jgi:hypothetical protein
MLGLNYDLADLVLADLVMTMIFGRIGLKGMGAN